MGTQLRLTPASIDLAGQREQDATGVAADIDWGESPTVFLPEFSARFCCLSNRRASG
jgi:hypothetical protein